MTLILTFEYGKSTLTCISVKEDTCDSTMNWKTQIDMDTLHLQQKEYIDTLLVPLFKLKRVQENMKSSHLHRISYASFDFYRNSI